MTENELSYKVVGAALEVHKCLGPGLLESVYENSLAFELRAIGFKVDQQYPMPVIYKEIRMESGFRLDMVVENKLIIEVKSVEHLLPVHHAQLLTYLRLSGRKLGLLINFHSAVLRDGIRRIVNNL